ncbi:hypothetical protein QQ045_033313 [Rhodiola kirilowii]
MEDDENEQQQSTTPFWIQKTTFRPNSVKRSWDSLNLVLILFAIICAFLGRTNNNNENLNSASGRFRSPSPSPSYSNKEQRSREYSDRSYSSSRMRSRSSYPDLTIYENSPWDYIRPQQQSCL